MLLHQIPFEQLRAACRQKLETCELWLRRLIHETFSSRFGKSYFNDGKYNDKYLFRKEIREHANRRKQEHPAQYNNKEIDTLLLEHIIDTICKPELYLEFFSPALCKAFPDGCDEARTFLLRLVPIRNALSHANPISVHDAERVLCYSDDVIESIKEFYKGKLMEQEYNAPQFTKFSDSFGNRELLSHTQKNLDYRQKTVLRPGDNLRLEVEVDSSFPPETYSIFWKVANIPKGDKGSGTCLQLALHNRHVSEQFIIEVQLKSNRDWHRHGNFDARLTITYKVLPPLDQ